MLSKAMYCTTKKVHAQLLGYVNTTGLTTVDFSSILPIRVGGTSSMKVPSSKLSRLELGKVDDKVPGYLAKAFLGTGEQLEVAVTPEDGIYVPSGVFGISEKGWVWVPWYAVTSVEYFEAK
ncbi:MAG: hypothetical protein IPK22_24470 [Verrucomicrobiaceae bacterium]|nr:hypothetical protein [Verrucomicrobiaceae bacterium]